MTQTENNGRVEMINLDSVDSTNTWLKQNPPAGLPVAVTTRCQTAGRGQRGNSWEAAPGMNITMSMAWRPGKIAPAEQFAISRAVSLAIVDFLREAMPEADRQLFAIKWPNDIYYGHYKICGILIEHTISSTAILRTIIGIGLNVNQIEFTSRAPNPISMAMISGREYNVDTLSARLADRILTYLEAEDAAPGANAEDYFTALYRREGMHPYALPDGTRFNASIEKVDPTGLLYLRHDDDALTIHPFKSVTFLLP